MTSMVKNIIQRKKSDFYPPQCSLLTSENEYITFDKRLPAPRSLHRHTYTGYTFSSFNYLKWSLLVLTNDLSLQNYLETSRPGGDMSFIDKIPNWFSFINWGENPWQLVVRIKRNCTKDLKREQSTHYFQFSVYFYNHKFILFLLWESDRTSRWVACLSLDNWAMLKKKAFRKPERILKFFNKVIYQFSV